MGKRWRVAAGLALGAIVLWPATAQAGMPAPWRLSDVGQMRFEIISFFVLVLLVSAAVIRLLWNSLARTFTRLPRLNYWRALSLVMIWGLLFTIILLMISGARELMTPGAWERDGALYRLKEGAK